MSENYDAVVKRKGREANERLEKDSEVFVSFLRRMSLNLSKCLYNEIETDFLECLRERDKQIKIATIDKISGEKLVLVSTLKKIDKRVLGEEKR